MKTTALYELPSAIHDGIISTDNDAVSSAAITMMTNNMNTAVYLAVIDAESSADDKDSSICDEDSSAVTIMTTTVPVTYEATSSAVRTTTSNELPSAGNDSTSQSSFHSSFNHGDTLGYDTDNYYDEITVYQLLLLSH